MKRTTVVGLVVVGTLSLGVAAHAVESQPVDTTCPGCTLLSPGEDYLTGEAGKLRKPKEPKDELL